MPARRVRARRAAHGRAVVVRVRMVAPPMVLAARVRVAHHIPQVHARVVRAPMVARAPAAHRVPAAHVRKVQGRADRVARAAAHAEALPRHQES